MNTTMAPDSSLTSDSLLLTTNTAASAARARLAFTDRLELRLGLWLLLRAARRFDAASDHEDHSRRLAGARARAQREHAALRAHALGTART